jgi:hypothetical protein
MRHNAVSLPLLTLLVSALLSTLKQAAIVDWQHAVMDSQITPVGFASYGTALTPEQVVAHTIAFAVSERSSLGTQHGCGLPFAAAAPPEVETATALEPSCSPLEHQNILQKQHASSL